jgi:hypothetical protein
MCLTKRAAAFFLLKRYKKEGKDSNLSEKFRKKIISK